MAMRGSGELRCPVTALIYVRGISTHIYKCLTRPFLEGEEVKEKFISKTMV